jgi:DeoR family fructose operon transcriptional repressor
MLECGSQTILLADSSKVGKVSLCRHGELDDVDVLITDSGIAPTELTRLHNAGMNVVQA